MTAGAGDFLRSGLALLLCGAAVACHASPVARPPAPEATCPPGHRCLSDEEVVAAGLKLKSIVSSQAASTIRIGGRIAFDDLKVAHVVSPLSGRLAEINVVLGQQVVRGAPLATLHAPQMGTIYADAASALADKVAAERDYARQKSLYAERAVALKDFEAAQNRLSQAKANAVQAVEKRDLLGAPGTQASDRYILRAPIDGTVVARDAAPNAEVQGLSDAGKDAPTLFTIGSLDSVWAVGDAFPLDATAIRPGNPAEVQVTAYSDKTYPSQVEWLAASVDEASNTVRVRCRLSNDDHTLKPDMTASIRITTSLQEGLWLPERAVFRLGDDPYVFVERQADAAGRHFEQRKVKVVRPSADKRLLLGEGLIAGETIVVEHGIFLLGSGD